MIDPVPVPPSVLGLLSAEAVEDLEAMPELLASGELVCDRCGHQLHDPDVSVLFLDASDGPGLDVAFVHPGRCARSFFRSLGGAA